MATATPLAYNTGSSIPGTQQIGSLAVGFPTSGFTSSPQFWNGPDEELGYVIAVPVSGNTQPTPLSLTWDPNFAGTGIVLSSGNTIATVGQTQSSVLGTRLITSPNKVMYSIRVNQLVYGEIGFGLQDMDLNSYVGGDDGKSIGFSSSGDYLYAGTQQDSGLPTWGSVNDVVDVALDLNTGIWWIRVNGGNWNGTRNEDPSSGTGSVNSAGLNNLYAAVTPTPANIQGKVTLLSQPIYSVPSGFTFLGETNASVGFYRSTGLTDSSFINLTNSLFSQSFSSATEASIWLTNNGYWNSYITPVLYLDAANPSSYPGTGTVWTDLIGGKVFNLLNGADYSSAVGGGSIHFLSEGNQYANCSTSLQSLPTFTISVWHYWDGNNTGGEPCILTEVYPGNTGAINYILGAPQGITTIAGYFATGFQLSNSFILTPYTWYNIVVTCDASQLVTVYLNGTTDGSVGTAGAQPSSSQGGINLMRRWDNPEFWGGYLATVGIYDKALTQSQVSSIFNLTKSRFGY